MEEKIVGYMLIVIGVLIIVFSGISVYLVFTKHAQPVQLFNFSGISLDVGKLMAGALPPQAQTTSLPSMKQEFISSDMINGPLNLSLHLFLMGFLASVGQKLASLGTMLVRPIVVKVKEKVA